VALPAFNPNLGAPETEYYRNKIEYTFGTKEFTKEKPAPPPPAGGISDPGINKESFDFGESKAPPPVRRTPDSFGGGFRGAGFHAKGFFDKIVNIEKCYLQAEPTNEIRLAVKEFAIANDWTFYDISNNT